MTSKEGGEDTCEHCKLMPPCSGYHFKETVLGKLRQQSKAADPEFNSAAKDVSPFKVNKKQDHLMAGSSEFRLCQSS